jgi:hypothetical protein
MIQKFLHIRYLQIKRSLQDLSIVHMLGLSLFLFFAFGLKIFSALKSEEGAWGIVGVTSAIDLYLQIIRKDKRFVSIVTKSPLSIFAAEYMLLNIPMIILLFFTKHYLQGFTLVLIPMLIALINKVLKQNNGSSFFSKYIAHDAFEWRAGMRKSGRTIVICYTLALVFSWVRIVPILLLFFALAVITEFFRECEPLSILTLSREKTNAFLLKKIGKSLLIYCLFTLPIVILSSILVPDLWYVAPAFFIMACINIANFILAKYAFYHPNFDTGGGGMLTQLSLFSIVIPVFAPLPFFLIFWNYFKAKPKLDYYLNNDERRNTEN